MAARPRRKAADMSSDYNQFPTCVVCMETLGTDGGPASLPCGHNGCLACLQKVQRHSAMPSCPLCRTAFDADTILAPNLDLREALERAQEKFAKPKGGVVEDAGWIPISSGKIEYPSIDHSTYEQVQPELNLWNVLSGLVAIVSGKNKSIKEGVQSNYTTLPKCKLGQCCFDEDEVQPWDSVLLPSAPPLSGPSEGIRLILESEPPQWLPDSAAVACMQCSTSFRPFTCGRHHCRLCGGIFCRSCSSGRCLLPVKFREREPKRVCDACYERLEPIQRVLGVHVSNAAQVATHDVTDLSCMRSWVNTPLGLSMEQEIYKATNTLRSYAKIGMLKPERGIPDAVLKDAKGLAIVTIMKAGVMITYKFGTGLVVARRPDGSWSAPAAIACAGIGWGAQVGGELTDFIIVLRTEEAVRAFGGRMHLSLGAGVSAAAGPVGRSAEADVRAGDGGTAACYSYSCSKGMFVGVSVEGSVVTRRSDTNARFYGDSYVTALDILSGLVAPPRAAAPLYSSLSELFNTLPSSYT